MIELPKELTQGFWDGKKGALPDGSDVESKLKLLQKKHESVGLKALGDDWAKSPESAHVLKQDYSPRPGACRRDAWLPRLAGADVSPCLLR